MQISTLISVCCLKDIETWVITSQYIVHNISAKEYRVIVPDLEINEFRKKTPNQFIVMGESCYTKLFRDQLFNLLPQDKKSQLGWYLQQFIKLLAIQDNQDNAIVLIWDADTAPIRKLEFISPDGKLIYYKGTEYHLPYFETIERLIGLRKIVSFSFIAQCFVIKVSWLNTLFGEIEKKFGTTWIEAVLSQIDFEKPNSFSEYETLGTFISNRYSQEVIFTDRPWWRLGNSLLNHVAFLKPKKASELSGKFDFISFEKWERPKPYFLKVSIPYFFKIFLPSLISIKTNEHI